MSNFKRIEIQQTPVKFQTHQTNYTELQSAQKQKYDNIRLNTTREGEGKDIYDNQIPVVIKSHDREDWNTFLNLKIYNTSQGNQGQIMHIELTDESNPQFLYMMNLSESEFLHVKNEQHLLVDFYSFPTKLTEIIDLAIGSTHREDKINFQCNLDIKSASDASFNILEINQFKSLTHLSLKFRCATDEFLNKFLATKWTKEHQDNQDLRIKNQKLEDNLSIKTQNLEYTQNQLKELQENQTKTLEQLTIHEQRKQNESKQQQIQKEELLRNQYEQKKNELVEKYENEINQLKHKLQKITENLNYQNEKNQNLEQSEKELTNKLKLDEKEINMITKEIESLRIQNKELDTTRFSQEKKITEYQLTNQSLEKQLKDKEEIIRNSRSLYENSSSQVETIQGTNESYKKQIEKLERKIELCTDEINKGNDIIQKFQGDLQKQKSKIKQKNQLFMQQDQTIAQLQEAIERKSKEVNDVMREKDNQSLKVKEVENHNNDLKQKIMESQKLIEQNQSMITYLNKQLNDNQKQPSAMNYNKFSSTSSFQPASSFQPGFTAQSKFSTYEEGFRPDKKDDTSPLRSYTQSTLHKSPINVKSFNTNSDYQANTIVQGQSNFAREPETFVKKDDDFSKYLVFPKSNQNIAKRNDDDDLCERVAPIKYSKPI